MAIVVPDTGDQLMLGLIINQINANGSTQPPGESPSSRKLKLFSNNLVPSKTTVIGDIVEVTTPGYSSKDIQGYYWTISNIDGDNIATYPIQTFTLTSGVDVYGYYVTDYTGAEILWIERFSTAPFELPPGGGTITIELKITLN